MTRFLWRFAALTVSSVVLATFGSSSFAAIETYRLHNHPDGNQLPPPYGLRLDELVNATTSHDVYSFTFDNYLPGTEDDSVGVSLIYDTVAKSIRITGTVYGGRDVGSVWDASRVGLWAIDFLYAPGSVAVEDFGATDGNNDLKVASQSDFNSGTIKLLSTGFTGVSQDTVFYLEDKSDGNFSFKFNDHDNHRLNPVPPVDSGSFVGWGWLTHGTSPNIDSMTHVTSSDWLFTGEFLTRTDGSPVPEATSIISWSLLAAVGVVFYRRRRTFVC
jgi:hypothetical protein